MIQKAMKKMKPVLLLTALVLLVLPVNQAQAAGRYNETLRVGLFYGTSAKSSYTISGSNLRIMAGGQNLVDSRASRLEVKMAESVYISDNGERNYEDALGAQGMVYYDGSRFYAASTSDGLGDTVKYDGLLLQIPGGESLIVDKASAVTLESSDGIIGIDGSKYRESLEFTGEGYAIRAINLIGVDNYLKGVVAKEMPASWNEEALRAQAVVARNYVATNQNKHASQGFHICGSTHCQVYGGYGAETARTNAAVEATAGELMYYGGAVVEGYFHSSSGGRTENSENLWSAALPYLVGVEDAYSTGTPYDNWETSFTLTEIKALLANNGVNIGDVTGLSITKTTENGRAYEVTIQGTSGKHVLQKDRIRIFFGGERLKSTYFTIENSGSSSREVPSNNGSLSSIWTSLKALVDLQGGSTKTGSTITFKGKGYGHGVGMSQYGAQNMAKAGYNYQAILKHYFTGVDVK